MVILPLQKGGVSWPCQPGVAQQLGPATTASGVAAHGAWPAAAQAGTPVPPGSDSSGISRTNDSASWWTQMPAGNEQCTSLVMLSARKRHGINCGCLGESGLGVGLPRRWHGKHLYVAWPRVSKFT